MGLSLIAAGNLKKRIFYGIRTLQVICAQSDRGGKLLNQLVEIKNEKLEKSP